MDEEPDPIATEKSVPIPERLTVVGPPAALCWMVTAALQVPVESGRNVTLNRQFAPGARLAPQLFVRRKTPVFTLGSSAMLEIASVAPPVFVNVTVCTALVVFSTCAANVSEAGTSETAAGVTPVPLIAMLCGLPIASLTITIAAVLVPALDGVNTTVIVQLAPGSRTEQLWVRLNSDAFTPLSVTLLMVRVAPLLLVNVKL